ncbi:MAG TPA: hypothetical protein VF026_09930 [Ktedonobacteraceae bacterium]
MPRWWSACWDGERVEAIVEELACSPQTVRRRLYRFNARSALKIWGTGPDLDALAADDRR